MKENLMPTKDLKTGMKATGVLAREVFESLKPSLKRAVGNQARSILKTLSRNRQ